MHKNERHPSGYAKRWEILGAKAERTFVAAEIHQNQDLKDLLDNEPEYLGLKTKRKRTSLLPS